MCCVCVCPFRKIVSFLPLLFGDYFALIWRVRVVFLVLRETNTTIQVLSRQIAELGIYPAVDPLDSTSRMLDPRVIGDEHYETARATQKLLQDYKGLQVQY